MKAKSALILYLIQFIKVYTCFRTADVADDGQHRGAGSIFGAELMGQQTIQDGSTWLTLLKTYI